MNPGRRPCRGVTLTAIRRQREAYIPTVLTLHNWAQWVVPLFPTELEPSIRALCDVMVPGSRYQLIKFSSDD